MSRLLSLVAAVVLLWPLAARAEEPVPAVRVEAAEAQTITATISYEIRTRDFTVTRWMAFLPEPPELPSQPKVKVTGDPAGKVVKEKSQLGRKVRFIDVSPARPTSGAKLLLSLEMKATLFAHKLVPLKSGETPPFVAPLPAEERKYYLAASRRIDHDSDTVQTWLDTKKLRRRKDELPLAFATRVLEVIRSDFSYRFAADDDRRASVAVEQGKTDCGGMTFAFVAALRANAIPARVLVGRIAKPRGPNSTPADLEYDRPHVRAELFVGGVGWVPVDPTYANGERSRPVEDFVGRDSGDMLVLHIDLDLKLPFPDQDRSTDMMQVAPSYWLNGRGSFDATLGPTGWELKATPAGEK